MDMVAFNQSMVVRTIDLQMIFPWSNQSSVDQWCFTTVNHLSVVFFRSESLLFRYFDEGFHNFHPYGGQFPLKAKVTPKKKKWTKKQIQLVQDTAIPLFDSSGCFF